MLATSQFKQIHSTVLNPHMIALWSDLWVNALDNQLLYKYNCPTVKYRFTIFNSKGYAVTVKLSKNNNITVRGKVVNTISRLYKAIESIED